jgi:hypothetical protein
VGRGHAHRTKEEDGFSANSVEEEEAWHDRNQLDDWASAGSLGCETEWGLTVHDAAHDQSKLFVQAELLEQGRRVVNELCVSARSPVAGLGRGRVQIGGRASGTPV